MEIKLIKTAKLYLRRNDIKNSAKKRDEKIRSIVKELLIDKSSKESIKMLEDITSVFNERLDSRLKESLETTEQILNYKKLLK